MLRGLGERGMAFVFLNIGALASINMIPPQIAWFLAKRIPTLAPPSGSLVEFDVK